MENEMWEDAINELEKALVLKRRLLPSHDRQLATLHYQNATAALARMEKARHDANDENPLPLPGVPPPPSPEECAKIAARFQTKAADEYEAAAGVLAAHHATLAAESEAAAEVAELLSEVRAKVEEVRSVAASSGESASAGAAPSSADAGVTTIGFGAPSATAPSATGKRPMRDEGTTTIGFGAPPAKAGGAASAFAPSAFAAPSSTAPVKDLGVMGGKSGAKRVRLEPTPTTTN